MAIDEFGNETGETLIPDKDAYAAAWHKARYEWSLQFMKDKGVVLDVGCGIGYGSEILLRKASEYIGFDKYDCREKRFIRDYSKPNATMLVHSANEKFPFEDNSFDMVTCFEAIEHIEKDAFAIEEIHRVLKEGGSFCCSTPLLRIEGRYEHYHIRDYRRNEFMSLIESRFSKVSYYGQDYGVDIIPMIRQRDVIYILSVAYK